MKYMLLVYGAEDSWTDQEKNECMIDSKRICDRLISEGKLVSAAPLHSVNTATCIRVRQNQREVTDGPFAETTEQLGGFYILDVDNLDQAMEIAAEIPPAKRGTIEIRPMIELEEIA